MWGEAIGTASGLGVLAESLLGFIEATHGWHAPAIGVSPYRKPSLRNGGNLHNNHPSHQLIAYGKMQGYCWKQNTCKFKWCMQGPKRWWFSPLKMVRFVTDGDDIWRWKTHTPESEACNIKRGAGRKNMSAPYRIQTNPGDGGIEKDHFFRNLWAVKRYTIRSLHLRMSQRFGDFSKAFGLQGFWGRLVCSPIWIDTPICFLRIASIHMDVYRCIRICNCIHIHRYIYM